MIKTLSISTDRKLFVVDSSVFSRSLKYASKLDELHIVIFTKKSQGFKDFKQGNLFVYPTNSISIFAYVFDAIRISKEIIKTRELKANNGNITCQDPFETGLVGAILSRKYKVPLQIQVHTDFLSSYFKKSYLNKLRVLISNFTIPRANGIRVVSSVIESSIRKKFPNLKASIDVLPIWVDTLEQTKEELELNVPDYNPLIFMASRLEEEKRIDNALRIFKKIEEKFPEAGLLIAGDGSKREDLEKQKNDLGLKNVTFLGWREDVSSIFFKSDIYLLTSDFEGYGMTLIQAASFNVPIVTTKVGLAKTDLFRDGVNSYVCPVGDIDLLTEKLSDLITNEEKRKSFVNNMRDSIRSIGITEEEYVSRYVTLLEKILIK